MNISAYSLNDLEQSQRLTALPREASQVPVPAKVTSCGLPPPVSEIDTFAVREPSAVGLKVTVIEQLAPVATLVPQVLVWEKSLALVPVTVIDFTVMACTLVLVSVTVCGVLEEPTFTFPKLRLDDESCTNVPVPVRVAVCGLPGALSVTVMAAVWVLVLDGLNVTLIVQFAPASTLEPQVLVWLKSPLVVMLVIWSVWLPMFVSVTF